jgi:hypothetical protein
MSPSPVPARPLRRIRPEHRPAVEALARRIADQVAELLADEARRDPRLAAALRAR